MLSKLIYILIFPLFFIPLFADDLKTLQPLVQSLIDIAEQHKLDQKQPIPIIAIGGCPGVGKSYLTKKIQLALEENGINSLILALDHFNLSPMERKKIGTEWDIRHLKVQELHACLTSIFTGEKSIEKPVCNQLTGEVSQEFLELHKIDLILFDGLYTLCSKPPLNFFDYCFLGVFLEANESDICKWKWEREGKKTHPRTKEEFEKHMQALLQEYYQNIEYSKENATFIIKKERDHSYELKVSALFKLPMLKAA